MLRPLPSKSRQRTDTSPGPGTPETEAEFGGENDAKDTRMGMDVRIPADVRRRRTVRRASMLIGGLLGLLAVVVYVAGEWRSVRVDGLELAAVKQQDLTLDLPIDARVIPDRTVYLDTVSGGRVAEVFVDQGATVGEGQAILRIENTDLELALIRQEGTYAEQLSNLTRARLELDRSQTDYREQIDELSFQLDEANTLLKKLQPYRGNAVPENDVVDLEREVEHLRNSIARTVAAKNTSLEHSEDNLSQLRQSLVRMESSLAVVRAEIDALTVVAPIDGQLSELLVEVGAVASAATRLGRIDRTENLRLSARVDEFYLHQIDAAVEGRATLEGRPVAVRMDKVFPQVENRQFEVELRFENPVAELLRLGQTVPVTLELGRQENAIVIPRGAYIEDTGGRWVFVVSPDGRKASRRDITAGRRTSQGIEVVSGLTANETVIVSSYAGLGSRKTISLR